MTEETIPFTPEGFAELSSELKKLKDEERPKVIQDIAEARAHGDLRENAEYHAAREKQGFIEARIKELEGNLSRAKVIDFRGQKVDQIRIGAYVTLIDEESADKKRYRIVGDLEADITKNKISMSSPIAKALLGKKIGDTVEIRAPKGTMEYSVDAVEY